MCSATAARSNPAAAGGQCGKHKPCCACQGVPCFQKAPVSAKREEESVQPAARGSRWLESPGWHRRGGGHPRTPGGALALGVQPSGWMCSSRGPSSGSESCKTPAMTSGEKSGNKYLQQHKAKLQGTTCPQGPSPGTCSNSWAWWNVGFGCAEN